MKRNRSVLQYGVFIAFFVSAMFLATQAGAGDLQPTDPPGPTMRTLDEIYKKLEGIEKMVWRRFIYNYDGTVTDSKTGLIWMKDANSFGIKTWEEAVSECNNLADGAHGLIDGSVAGYWRLPSQM